MYGESSMNTTKVLSEVQKVFGLSAGDVAEFLDKMDYNKPVSGNYFQTLITEKIPAAKYFTKLKEPTAPLTKENTNFWGNPFSNEVVKNSQNMYAKQKLFYNELVKRQGLRNTPNPNEIHVNASDYEVMENGSFQIYPKGEFGMVKFNKSRRPFVYKYIDISKSLTNEIALREFLKEALIQTILQVDPVAGPFICKLDTIYYDADKQALILKMENLDKSASDLFSKFIKRLYKDPNDMKRILLKIYGPILEILPSLRETYAFVHGDLHSKNIMLKDDVIEIKGRNLVINEDKLKPKLIDFGLSKLVFNGKLYGDAEAVENYGKELELFLAGARNDYFPNLKVFIPKTEQNKLNHMTMEKLLRNTYESYKKGGKRKTKKMKRKVRKTRKTASK